MSKITNDGLTWSGTVVQDSLQLYSYGNSGHQRVISYHIIS